MHGTLSSKPVLNWKLAMAYITALREWGSALAKMPKITIIKKQNNVQPCSSALVLIALKLSCHNGVQKCIAAFSGPGPKQGHFTKTFKKFAFSLTAHTVVVTKSQIIAIKSKFRQVSKTWNNVNFCGKNLTMTIL